MRSKATLIAGALAFVVATIGAVVVFRGGPTPPATAASTVPGEGFGGAPVSDGAARRAARAGSSPGSDDDAARASDAARLGDPSRAGDAGRPGDVARLGDPSRTGALRAEDATGSAPTTELRTRIVNGEVVIESVPVAPPPLAAAVGRAAAAAEADVEAPEPGQLDDDDRIADLSTRAGLEARERCELARLLTARAATLLLEGARDRALADSKRAMAACGEDGVVAASRARLLALAAGGAPDDATKRALLEESVHIADDAHVLRQLADVVERQGDAARAAALRQQAGGAP